MNSLQRQPTTLAERGQQAIYRMRTVNPRPPGRKASFKTLLGLGSQVLDRLGRQDPHYVQDGLRCWTMMEAAWNSPSRADRRTALTCLQVKLQQWTAEDANVAGDADVQQFRKVLHLALDH